MIGVVDVQYGDDIAYIRLGKGKVAQSREVADGLVLDLDEQGQALGLEVLGLKRRGLREGKVSVEWLRPRPDKAREASERNLAGLLSGGQERKAQAH
jgi:uncharacterized protein YuzE